LLRERRSVRRYKRDPIPRETLERILEAARYAPTGTNSQNVNHLVLTKAADIAELQQRCIDYYARIFKLARNPAGRAGIAIMAGRRIAQQLEEYLPKVEEAQRRLQQGDDRLLYHATAVWLVHAESWDTCSPFNCDVSIYNASLMAHSLGVGCCFNGFVQQAVKNSRPLKTWLGIPKDHACYMTMTMGLQNMRYRRLAERQPAQVRWM